MSNSSASTSLVIENSSVDAIKEMVGKKRSAAAYALFMLTKKAGEIKDKVAEKGAEISQRQDRIKFLHEILQTINKLSDEKGLDITNDQELQEKLKVAKEMGVNLDESCLKFSAIDRDFLKESLQLAVEDISAGNKLETQKMQMLIQEADRWLTLANTLLKNSERTIKAIVDKIR